MTTGRSLRWVLNWSRRPQMRCSALSRTEQVLAMITSATFMSVVRSYPAAPNIEKTTSVSPTFIWHPYVSM